MKLTSQPESNAKEEIETESHHNSAHASSSLIVGTVIVTFNPVLKDIALALNCHAQSLTDFYVVVDNGSINIDQLAEIIDQTLPSARTHLVRMGENLGLARALNVGIAVTKELGCSHVVLFDQDSKPKSDTLSRLLEAWQRLTHEGTLVGAVGASQFDSRTGSEYPQRRIKGLSMEMIWPSREGVEDIEVSFLITSGCLISISTLDEVGSMREDFFIDLVDIEWCFRAAHQGFRLFCIRSAIIEHALGDRRRVVMGSERSVHNAVRHYYMFRNMLALARMNTAPIRYRTFETIYFIAHAPVLWLASGCSRSHAYYIALGIAYGCMGRMGKAPP